MSKIIFSIVSIYFFFISNDFILAQWVQCNNGINSIGIGPIVVRGNDLFAGTVKGIFHSTNNGDSWVENNQGLPQKFLHITDIAIYENNIFAGIRGNGIYLSTDNGYSWTGKNNGLTEKLVTCLAFSEKNIFVGADNGIFLSTDYGENWTQKDSGISIPYIISLATRENKVYAGVEGLGVYLSTDNGDYWTQKNNGIKHLMIYSIAINGNDIIAGSYRGGIFLSTDNGDSWVQKNSGLLDTGVYRVLVYGRNIFAGTFEDGGVFLSINYGDSWSQINEGLTDLSISSFAINDTYIFAGTGSSGIFRAKLSELGLNNINEQIPIDDDFILSPNPASDKIKIRYLNEFLNSIELRIFNIYGQNIECLSLRNYPNTNQIELDVKSLSSGVYFAVINLNGKIITKPFVVMR